MHLNPIHRSNLVVAIAEHFDINTFKNFLLTTTLNVNLDRISLRDTLDDRVLDVVVRAEHEGWLSNLLSELKNARPGTALESTVDELCSYSVEKIHWYVCTDPERTRFIGHIPFVDRNKIREDISELRGQSLQNVLIIRGGNGVGKSYVWNYINYLFGSHFPAAYAMVDMGDYAEVQSIDDMVLMELILSALGFNSHTEIDQRAQGYARSVQLISQLRNKIDDSSPQNRFIAIDSIDNGSLSESGHTLLRQLVLGVSRGNLPGMRMILMGYDRDIPSTSTVHILDENLSSIGRDEIQRFFLGVASDIDVELADLIAEDAAERVMELTNMDDTNQLHDQITVVAKQLFTEG